MAEQGDQKKEAGKDDAPKRLTKEEYDRLVQGVDDIFFGGLDEPDGEKKPLPERSANETPQSEDDVRCGRSCVESGVARTLHQN